MTNEKLQLPLYAKASLFIIGLFTLGTILYIARSIIIPLVFAFIIAIVFYPVVNFLVKKGINRIFAIVIVLLITIIAIAAFSALLFSQVSRFTESLPLLVEKFNGALNQTVTSVSGYLDINSQKIHEWFAKTTGELINTSGASIGKTILNIGNLLIALFLVPVYVFLILFYQPLLREFIHRLFNTSHQSRVSRIITQIKNVIQRYLVGLLIETVIIATLEIITLLILGIEYAILLGIIGALLNLIPYIGGLTAVALPIFVALVTKSTAWYAIYILVIYYIIQLIDNNYIVPKIVASKVKINALFSIIVVFVGNALWGISGMFLSIPLLAIVKLIFDQIEPLKPWGFLLGDSMPSLLKIRPIINKLIKKSS